MSQASTFLSDQYMSQIPPHDVRATSIMMYNMEIFFKIQMVLCVFKQVVIGVFLK